MKTKLFAFSTRDFKKKRSALNLKMIYALLLALQKQERKISFDFSNMTSSLNSLIERGFIFKEKNTHYGTQAISMAGYKNSYSKVE